MNRSILTIMTALLMLQAFCLYKQYRWAPGWWWAAGAFWIGPILIAMMLIFS